MPTNARRLPDLVAWFGIVLLAAFTLVEKGPSRALQWPWYLYAQLLAIAPLLWLLVQTIRDRRFVPPRGGPSWALAAFAAAMIAAVLASPYRQAGLALLPIVLVPISTAYAIAHWLAGGSASSRQRALELGGAVFLCVASGLALVGWLWAVIRPQCSAGVPLAAALGGRNEWLLGHTVYIAGLGLITATWLAGLARERAGAVRIGCLLGAALGLLTLLSSASRSGFIGLGLWLAWFLVHEVRRRRWSLARTCTVGGMLALGALGLALLHPRTRLMVSEWHASGTINTGDRQRLAMAEFGGIILREHPLLGIGPGATPLVYPTERARLSGGVEAALQLHSVPVQWAADAGLLGLAAAGLVVFTLWSHRRAAPPSFAAGALLAYAGLSLTDYQLDIPLFAFGTGTLLGLCLHTGQPPTPGQSPVSRHHAWAAVGLAAVLLAYVATQVSPLRARAAFSGAIEALSAGDAAAFRIGMAETHRLAPQEPFYYNLHACLLADIQAYPHWFPPVDLGPDRHQEADALLRRSLQIDPGQELPHNHLAWHLLPSQPAQAAAHFRAAFHLQPDKASLYLGLACAALAQQQTELAQRALAMELVNDPAFIASPEWRQLEAAAPGIAAAAARTAALEFERLAASAPAADPLRYARRSRYAAALLRWLVGDEATPAAALANAEPAQADILAWLAGQPVPLPAQPAAAWQVFAHAAARPEAAAALLARHYAPTSLDERGQADLLQALGIADRRTLLLGTTASTTQHPPRIYRERIAYPLLQHNLDAPAPRDPYLPPVNRLVRDFFGPLFPEKGFLPGPVLLQAQDRLGLTTS